MTPIREEAELEKRKAERRAQSLTSFLRELSGKWSTDKSRTLDHVIFSPEIAVGAGAKLQQYKDIAVVEVEASKINPDDFLGNFIDLGIKYTPVELTRKMYLNPKNLPKFTWPGNRLLKLFGTIPEEEMRKPMMLDKDGEACITVLKWGRTTDLTVCKATAFVSYVRKYFTERDTAVSKERRLPPWTRNPALSRPKEIPALSWSMGWDGLWASSPAVAGPQTPLT